MKEVDIEIEKPKAKTKSTTVEVKPLKDFVIHTHEYHYELKKDEPIEVHKMFLPNLKTEKVIK